MEPEQFFLVLGDVNVFKRGVLHRRAKGIVGVVVLVAAHDRQARRGSGGRRSSHGVRRERSEVIHAEVGPQADQSSGVTNDPIVDGTVSADLGNYWYHPVHRQRRRSAAGPADPVRHRGRIRCEVGGDVSCHGPGQRGGDAGRDQPVDAQACEEQPVGAARSPTTRDREVESVAQLELVP